MQHSVKGIGENYEYISDKRGDDKKFLLINFFEFAKQNKEKYHLIKNGDDDFLVSSWYSDRLINDFKQTLK